MPWNIAYFLAGFIRAFMRRFHACQIQGLACATQGSWIPTSNTAPPNLDWDRRKVSLAHRSDRQGDSVLVPAALQFDSPARVHTGRNQDNRETNPDAPGGKLILVTVRGAPKAGVEVPGAASMTSSAGRMCDGLSRREFLRVGALGVASLRCCDPKKILDGCRGPVSARRIVYLGRDLKILARASGATGLTRW